jgi:hypothetical protein
VAECVRLEQKREELALQSLRHGRASHDTGESLQSD